MMNPRQRLTLLLLIMLLLSIEVAGVFTYFLYKTSFEQQRERLATTTQSQARLIEAVARFDALNSQLDHPEGATAATLSQIIDAQKHYKGFGETGELAFATHEGNRIIFKLSQRNNNFNIPEPVPFDSELAEPMRLALSGYSGTIIGLDYQGVRVLAAYEPVKLLKLGVVTKINLSEIRAPFIRAGIIGGSVSFVFIVFGILFFFCVSEPVVKDLEEKNAQLEKYKELFSQTNDLAYICDTKGNVLMVNAVFEKLTGHKPEAFLGKPFAPLFDDENLEKAMSAYTNTLNGESPKFEIPFKDTGILCEYQNRPFRNDKGEIIGVAGIGRDITERKHQEKKILHQAHFDVLTDLPNRFLALDRLSQLLKEAIRSDTLVAVLFLDLDDFKKVNDTLGHETGDKLLVEMALRLRSVARQEDTVGRLGGDEFIILLGGLTQPSDAGPVVENIMKVFRKPFLIENHVMNLSACVGISVFPGDGETESKLLQCADSAMYHAKKLGHNTYSYFTDAMNREVTRRLALEEQMHGAMERHEFILVYQPQIEVESGKAFGAEALLRWHNPALAHILPEEFIPLAE